MYIYIYIYIYRNINSVCGGSVSILPFHCSLYSQYFIVPIASDVFDVFRWSHGK